MRLTFIISIVLLNSCYSSKNENKIRTETITENNIDVNNTTQNDTIFIESFAHDDLENYNKLPNPIIKDTINLQKINGVISIPVKNKQSLVFTDNEGVPYDENLRHNFYIGYNPSIKNHLIESHFYEVQTTYLIDEDGNVDSLASIPIFSPNSNFLIEIDETINEYNSRAYSLNLRKNYQNKYIPIFKYLEVDSIININWTNDSTFCLTLINYDKTTIFKKFSIKNSFNIKGILNKPISDHWIGKYFVEIEGEKTKDGTSWRTYDFRIGEKNTLLNLDAFQSFIRCNGHYTHLEMNDYLYLYYKDNDSSCISNEVGFVLKRANNRYFIKSSNFNNSMEYISIDKE